MDWTTIIASLISAISAGGWLTSRAIRKRDARQAALEADKLSHEIERLDKAANLDHATKLIETYQAQVLEPMKQQIANLQQQVNELQTILAKARTCEYNYNCPLLTFVQDSQQDIKRN